MQHCSLDDLDMPFDLTATKSSMTPPAMSQAVQTPTGMELVADDWDDVTVVKHVDPLLLAACSLHERPTLRSMPAVVPPSRRPPIEVHVMECIKPLTLAPPPPDSGTEELGEEDFLDWKDVG
jgi:hypothetical protein